MVLEVVGPWVGVGLAFSGPTLLCLAMVSFFGGHNSGTASMATAVSAGAATINWCTRWHWIVLLYDHHCNSCQCWSCNSWGQRWHRIVLLCSHHGNSCQCWSCNSWGQRWHRVVLLYDHHCNSCQCWSCSSWGQRWHRVVLLCSHHGNSCQC